MRATYRDQLNGVVTTLADMTELTLSALTRATRALLTADLSLAEQVISDDIIIDRHHDELERQCFLMLARQAPVAGDLRTIVASLRMLTSLARMGDLAAHVAKVARLRFPDRAVPENLAPNFQRMCDVAASMVDEVLRALRDQDADTAQKLSDADAEMDELRRHQFQILLGDHWTAGIEAAVDVALLGRYFERYADHAVALGRQIIYVLTGEAPEGEDWPHHG